MVNFCSNKSYFIYAFLTVFLVAQDLIDLKRLTADWGQPISQLLLNVKFELQKEENILQNRWIPKLVAIFATPQVAPEYEAEEGFRKTAKIVIEQQFQRLKEVCTFLLCILTLAGKVTT